MIIGVIVYLILGCVIATYLAKNILFRCIIALLWPPIVIAVILYTIIWIEMFLKKDDA